MKNEKRKQGQVAPGCEGEQTGWQDGRKRLVAVYGTLMTGERNARWREGIETLTTGSIWGRLYDTGYGFPALVPADHTDNGASQVKVEVLECTPEQIKHMDILEGYPNLYRRETVWCEMYTGDVKQVTIYVMNSLPAMAKEIVTRDIKNYGTIADWRVYNGGQAE